MPANPPNAITRKKSAAILNAFNPLSSTKPLPQAKQQEPDPIPAVPRFLAPTRPVPTLSPTAVLHQPHSPPDSIESDAPPLLHLPSVPAHLYIPPVVGSPTPIFSRGRDRFPARPTRSRWLDADSIDNPYRYEVPAGGFDTAEFHRRWNSGGATWIHDSSIRDICHEETQAGIQYRVTVLPSAWKGRTILRGDTIIFRGFEPNSDIRYIITWEISRLPTEGGDIAYIQANAINEYQQSLEHGDSDWPTIGFLVPASLSNVLKARRYTIARNPHPPFDSRFSMSEPSITSPMLSLSENWMMAVPPSERRDTHISNKPGTILEKACRKVSWGALWNKN